MQLYSHRPSGFRRRTIHGAARTAGACSSSEELLFLFRVHCSGSVRLTIAMCSVHNQIAHVSSLPNRFLTLFCTTRLCGRVRHMHSFAVLLYSSQFLLNSCRLLVACTCQRHADIQLVLPWCCFSVKASLLNEVVISVKKERMSWILTAVQYCDRLNRLMNV